MRVAPSFCGAHDGAEPDCAVTDDGDGVAGLDAGADGGVVAGAGHVRQGGERGQLRVAEAALGRVRDLDEGGVGEGRADLLALAAVGVAVAERAAVDAVGLKAGPAGRAGAVVVGERGDDEVADGEVPHVRADGLDDADVLVADAADLVRVDAAVVPEVRAAHAATDDADDGVGRVLDAGVGALPDLDGVLAFEDGCLHGGVSLSGGVQDRR